MLFIASEHRTGGWLAEALAAQRNVEVRIEDAIGRQAGLARLREELYDLVLLSHEPGRLDALEFMRALRAGGAEEPVLVLGEQSDEQMLAACFHAGADSYVCVNTVTVRTLCWAAARAIERHRLVREHRAFAQAERNRLRLENQESRRLLGELRSLIRGVATIDGNGEAVAEPDVPLPPQLVAHYGELLRAYVIMGSGHLVREVAALAEMLATTGVSARQTLTLHLAVLEDQLTGLGNRSSRHVMTRADLLATEVSLHLAECYRRRYRDRKSPPRQMLLPGFSATSAADARRSPADVLEPTADGASRSDGVEFAAARFRRDARVFAADGSEPQDADAFDVGRSPVARRRAAA